MTGALCPPLMPRLVREEETEGADLPEHRDCARTELSPEAGQRWGRGPWGQPGLCCGWRVSACCLPRGGSVGGAGRRTPTWPRDIE